MERKYMIYNFRLLVVIFVCVLTGLIYSQTINSTFERITIKDGLSNSIVSSIIQDKKGFMWFATHNGLNKYDGFTFKVYRHIANDSTSLSQNEIRKLYEDNEGNIWIVPMSSSGGLNKFDPKIEKFTRYIHNPDDTTSISSDEIFDVIQDKSGNIWVVADNALNLVVNKKTNDKTSIVFRRYYNPPNVFFTKIFENRNGKLLLIAKDLYCFDKKSNKIIKTNTVIKDEEIHVYSACEDRHGNIWLGTNTSGIIKLDYDKKTNSYERAELGKINAAPTKRTYVLIDYKNRIWIGTDSKGLFQYNEKEDRLINFVKNETNLNSISDNTIFSLYIDRSGVLWIGTFTMGLCKYDLFRKEFYHYKSIKGNPNSLGGNVISSIHGIRPGELWVGSDNGGGVSRFIFDNINEAKIIQYKFDQINANNNVLSLVQRKNGNVWIGITGEAISIIKPEKSGTNELPIMKTFVHKGWPFSIFEDRDETIWVGAWGTGLTRYYNPDNYINFINDPENPNSLCDNIIWAISEDQSGNMWIGGRGKGLSILPAKEKNKSNPEFINYKHDERDPRSLSNNLINVFCQDHEGNMWIGTGGGLNKVIKAGNSFSDLTANDKLEFISYHIEDGLPSETILGIVEDNNGDLWISTLNGLAKFITSKDSFIYYGISDGLQSREFGHNAYFKDENGRIYFGGPNGLNAFYPDSIKPNPLIPQVIFTDLKVFYKSVGIGEKINGDVILAKSLSETSEITLSHKNNIFFIEFAALHFTRPEKNGYVYKLVGFDKDWVETSADRRFASYTNLPAGEYTFKVKASNNDGLWNEEGTSLKIIITPPFWATWWFRLVVVVFVSLSILISYKMRTTQIRRRNAELAEINTRLHMEIEEKHRIENEIKLLNMDLERRVKHRTEELESFAYSVSHDLRAPLRSMQGFSHELIEGLGSKLEKKYKNYLNRVITASQYMSRLIDDLLRLSRVTRTNIKKEKINLTKIAQQIENNLKVLEPRREVKFDIEKGLEAYGDKNLIQLALDNLISNAWKFTENLKDVVIEIKKTEYNAGTAFMVKDNGIGFEMKYVNKLFEPFQRLNFEHAGTGIGLATVKRIIELHGGAIWAEGKVNEGAIFYFTLPN